MYVSEVFAIIEKLYDIKISDRTKRMFKRSINKEKPLKFYKPNKGCIICMINYFAFSTVFVVCVFILLRHMQCCHINHINKYK